MFEMGGLGNVCEMTTALLLAVGRRIGLEKAVEINPWFFGDEEWARIMMEESSPLSISTSTTQVT